MPYHALDVAAVLAAGLENRPELLAALADGLGLDAGAEARPLLLTLATLHDAGKCAHVFQALRPAVMERLGLPLRKAAPLHKDGWRHDRIGHAVLCAILTEGLTEVAGLPEAPSGDLWEDIEPLIAAATGHHGRQPAPSEDIDEIRNSLVFQDDIAAATQLVRFAAEFHGWRRGVPGAERAARLSYLINGVLAVCDWLGSMEGFFRYQGTPMDPRVYWDAHALPSARRVLDAVRPALFRRLPARPPAGFAALYPGWRPSGLQAAVDRLFTAEALPEGPLLAVIEDLTGSGKTEAGDLIAQRLVALGRVDGLYVGLPTMATADAAFARKGRDDLAGRLFAGPEDARIVLAHGKAAHRPPLTRAGEETGEETGGGGAADWFARSTRRALLADLGVGTVDQALAGALRARHGPVRLAGLWRKLLVVDEVHAYDDYMGELLKALLRHQGWLGCPVVLMSATLPSRLRGDLITAYAEGAARLDPRWRAVCARAGALGPGAYPLLTLVHGGGIDEHPVAPAPGPGLRPVRVAPVHSLDAVLDAIDRWLRAERSVIWFRNTVGDAIQAHGRCLELTRAAGLPDPLLYHARFLPADRALIEARLLEIAGKDAAPQARRGRLVIATQAAEQSLDLDFDEAVIDLAPADAVCQRLGRRRRHARAADGALIAADAMDLRPDSPALLFTPPPDAAAEARWYAAAFPGAALIYPDPARLWLTARALTEPRTIPNRLGTSDELVMAKDLRPLLEQVYADPETVRATVPQALVERHEKAEDEAGAERGQGRRNALAFRDGLLLDWANGDAVLGDDENPSTRLGDAHTVLLAVVEDDRVRFASDETGAFASGENSGFASGETGDTAGAPLDASECRCPVALETAPEDEPLRARLRERLPERDRRRFDRRAVLFLTPAPGGGWEGAAKTPGDSERKPLRRVAYDRTFGLCVK